MFPAHNKAHSLLHTMLVTGVILVPTAIATPAVQDLVDLRNVINAAANAIGDPNNPNRGFGFNLLAGNGNMGTAGLLNNITTTILRGKYQLDTNMVRFSFPQTSTDLHTNISTKQDILALPR
jgi:Tfp pilus assembly major pilin PilA